VISHKHKCLFIHVPKAAGQSVERFFLNLHGLTWEERGQLLLGRNDNPEKGPPRLAHLTADEFVRHDYIDKATFDSYYKFAFVRDPWERVFSMYRHLRYYPVVSFEQFIFEELKKKLWNGKYWFVRPQVEFVCDANGEVIVDFVGRFENLQKDFEKVCDTLGLADSNLPHKNSYGKRSGRERIKKFIGDGLNLRRKIAQKESAREIFTEEIIREIQLLYKDDFEILNYSPEPSSKHQTRI